MALTVKDIMTLPTLSCMELVAGEKGTNRSITCAGIADHEFAEGMNFNEPDYFEKDSIVITSLLFARDNPDLILPAVEFLVKSGVSCFAYKTVIFDDLPDEVLAYANAKSFPIYKYADVWYENIIFEVLTAVERNDTRYLSETRMEQMIQGRAGADEVEIIRRGISLLSNRTVSACYIKTPSLDAERIFRNYYMLKNLREKFIATKYDGGLFILISTLGSNEDAHRVILNEACQTLSLPLSTADIILSRLHPATELNKAFQEAYYGWIASLVSLYKVNSYEDLGVYSAILPLAKTPELKSYSENYLDKVKAFEDTIKVYINNGGDVVATSVDMQCHPNTVRYRLNRMKELTGAKNQTDHELFRDLSIAYVVSAVLSRKN